MNIENLQNAILYTVAYNGSFKHVNKLDRTIMKYLFEIRTGLDIRNTTIKADKYIVYKLCKFSHQ